MLIDLSPIGCGVRSGTIPVIKYSNGNCRVLSIFLRLLVGVLLLSSIRIEPLYLQLGEPEPVIAGLDQFNASLASTSLKDSGFLPLWFTMRISSLLSDPGNAIMLPTTATQDTHWCSSGRCDCAAYILPGELDSIPLERPSQSDIRWDATSFEVEMAPAYQLEFKSVSMFSFDDTDCQLYGVQKSFSNSRPLLLNLTTISKAFKLCLKNTIDGDLFAGEFLKVSTVVDKKGGRRVRMHQWLPALV